MDVQHPDAPVGHHRRPAPRPGDADLHRDPERGLLHDVGPHLEQLNNRWYIYYSVEPRPVYGSRRTHVLESAANDPAGPCTYRGVLNLMPNNGWAIDGAVLKLNGALYFHYSAFHADGLRSIYIAPMNSPTSVSAHGTRTSAPTLATSHVTPIDIGSIIVPVNKQDRTSHCSPMVGVRLSPVEGPPDVPVSASDEPV
jgi:hypothetical protein